MAEGEHQVAIQLTPEDYVAFSAWYHRRTPEGRKKMRKLYALGVLLFVAFAWSEMYDPKNGIMHRERYAVYMAISAVVIGGGYSFFLWYIRPTLQRMSLRFGDRKQLLDPVSYSFAREGVIIRNQHGTGRLAWSGVKEIARTPKHLFLWLGGASAFILPVNQLADVAETERRIREGYSAARTAKGAMP